MNVAHITNVFFIFLWAAAQRTYFLVAACILYPTGPFYICADITLLYIPWTDKLHYPTLSLDSVLSGHLPYLQVISSMFR